MVDIKKAEEAVKMLLEAIGEDPNRSGLIETPKRVAKMYAEITNGYNDDAKVHLSRVFESENTDVVVEKDITFFSTCEHHLMPFFGKAHIAYIPNGKVVGLSKLGRLVDVYAKRLQLQEQMTTQIADSLMEELDALGAMVIIEAEHTCMSMRGVKKVGSKTITVATRGCIKDNMALQKSIQDMVI
ncbi:GTP cyclohydrolase I FolE [Peptostreptococcus faecalis]|uniref:GTP cyclohydrolase I FolE n=1 Tax=Peptostreptococcus faecalis TaxID=2045015 RepID=UPI000C7B2998|nr:GTP cyclohydrolase I FolE [Peptostreptococcus faecalis]